MGRFDFKFIEGLGLAEEFLKEPERVPELASPQAVTIGDEGALSIAQDPKTLDALRAAVSGSDQPFGQEAIRAFETANPTKRSMADLLDTKKTLEGAADALTSPTAKFLGRIGVETGIGLAAAGPVGASTALTRSVGRNFLLRSGERVGRGLARAAPNMARVGVGEAVGSLISEGFDPTLDPESGEFSLPLAIERAIETGGIGALSESLVPGVNDGIEFLRRGGFKLVDDAAEPVVEKILEEGKAAAPGFFAKSRTLQLLDNIASGSFLGGGAGKRVKREGAEIFDKEVQSFIDAYRTAAKGSIAVEQLAGDLLAGGVDAWKLTGKKMYGVIDELTGGGFKVDLNPLIKGLEGARAKFGGEGAQQILNDIERMRKFRKVSAGNTVSFEDAADIRSDLLALSRGGGDELVAGKKAALGKRMSPIVDAEMDKAFKAISGKPGLIEEVPGELIARKRDADAFWKAGSETFNTRLIRQLAADGPTGLINAAENSPGAMKIIKETIESIDTPVRTAAGEVLTGKQVWKNVQGQMLFEESRSVLGKSGTKVTGGLVEGQGMVNRLLAKEELFTEAFGKEGYQNLVDFFESAAFAQGKGAQTELPGRIFVQFAQAGALGTLPAALFLGVGDPVQAGATAGFVLAGPALGAALLANPRFTRLILKGTDKKIAFAKRTRALVQAVAMAQREGFIVADTTQRDKKDIEDSFGAPRAIPAFPAHLAGPR